MKKTRFDLVVCGGGVIGLSIAFQCSRMGRNVAIVERERIGRGSSWSGAGILPAGATVAPSDPVEQLRALSHKLHAEWSKLLQEVTGIDNEFRHCGGLYLGRSAAERATLAANRYWWSEHGIESQRLEKSELARVAPILQDSVCRDSDLESWWVPSDCRVRNPFHLRALESACRMSGVTIFEHSNVSAFEPGHDEWIVKCDSQEVVGERVCITAGAWTSQLLSSLGSENGIMPVRGQMILYKFPEKPFDCVINDGHRYLVPRDDGYVLAGSCEEEVGFVNETTSEKINEIRAWAEDLCPSLATVPIEKTWAGLRPGSFDSYPYLGSVPGARGLFVAAGHFRHGLHWSTGTAWLMQQLMFGEKTTLSLEPFQLQRGFGMLSV